MKKLLENNQTLSKVKEVIICRVLKAACAQAAYFRRRSDWRSGRTFQESLPEGATRVSRPASPGLTRSISRGLAAATTERDPGCAGYADAEPPVAGGAGDAAWLVATKRSSPPAKIDHRGSWRRCAASSRWKKGAEETACRGTRSACAA